MHPDILTCLSTHELVWQKYHVANLIKLKEGISYASIFLMVVGNVTDFVVLIFLTVNVRALIDQMLKQCNI